MPRLTPTSAPIVRTVLDGQCSDSLFRKIAVVAAAQHTHVVTFPSVVLRWLVSRVMLHPQVCRARNRYSRQEQILLTVYAEFDSAVNHPTLYRILERGRREQKSPLSRRVDP